MKAAAVALSYGVDGLRFLSTSDPVERVALQVVTEQAQEIADKRDRNLAAHIQNAIARLFK